METFDSYQNLLAKEVMLVCKDRTVIEFGPLNGYITKTIIANNPKKLTCVEPDPYAFWILENNKLNIDEVFNLTANEFYTQYRPANVVVACGLLYHLHSPLHFLELIINFSNPEYIILDSNHNYDSIPEHYSLFSTEQLNRGGEAFTGKYKTIPFALNITGYHIVEALNTLDYYLERVEKNIPCRNNELWGWMGVFKRKVPEPTPRKQIDN